MTRNPTEDPDVVHDTDEHRYEVYSGSDVAGFTSYRPNGGSVTFTHTEIKPVFQGKGLAARLIKAALDDVRRRQTTAIPVCPFVVDYIRHHPDYLDLVEEVHRDVVTP